MEALSLFFQRNRKPFPTITSLQSSEFNADVDIRQPSSTDPPPCLFPTTTPLQSSEFNAGADIRQPSPTDPPPRLFPTTTSFPSQSIGPGVGPTGHGVPGGADSWASGLGRERAGLSADRIRFRPVPDRCQTSRVRWSVSTCRMHRVHVTVSPDAQSCGMHSVIFPDMHKS